MPFVNIASLKESEISFPNFIKYINGEEKFENIGRLIINYNNGVPFNTLTPTAEDLNVIPAYHLLDVGNLSKFGTMGNFYYFKIKILNLQHVYLIGDVEQDVRFVGEKF